MGSPYTSRVSLLEDSPRRDRGDSLSGKNGLNKHLQLRLWSMETVSTFVRIHGDEYLQKFLSVSSNFKCYFPCFKLYFPCFKLGFPGLSPHCTVI